MPIPLAPVTRVVLPLALVGLLATGCSQGAESFDSNSIDPDPGQAQVVRTPSQLGTDLPYTNPPLVQPLPGTTGGVPGSPDVEPPESSPGESADDGADSAGN